MTRRQYIKRNFKKINHLENENISLQKSLKIKQNKIKKPAVRVSKLEEYVKTLEYSVDVGSSQKR